MIVIVFIRCASPLAGQIWCRAQKPYYQFFSLKIKLIKVLWEEWTDFLPHIQFFNDFKSTLADCLLLFWMNLHKQWWRHVFLRHAHLKAQLINIYDGLTEIYGSNKINKCVYSNWIPLGTSCWKGRNQPSGNNPVIFTRKFLWLLLTFWSSPPNRTVRLFDSMLLELGTTWQCVDCLSIFYSNYLILCPVPNKRHGTYRH